MTAPPLLVGAAGARRRRALAAAMLLWPWATGCYTHHQLPEPSAVAPGAMVTLAITDRGRVSLGDSLGAGVARLSGRVSERTDSVLVLRVAAVEYLNGQLDRWNGERLAVPRQDVGSVAERRFSRSRTWLAVGATIASVALAVSLVSLVARGIDSGTGPRPPGGGGGTQ